MLIKEIPLLQNICFLYSSSKCFEFTWTEGSNRNETSNTCNTGDEIPCYDPQLSTPEPPTSEEIYKPEFQQGKICDKGSGSLCIKVKKTPDFRDKMYHKKLLCSFSTRRLPRPIRH